MPAERHNVPIEWFADYMVHCIRQNVVLVAEEYLGDQLVVALNCNMNYVRHSNSYYNFDNR
jgi:hypothetical protein